MENLLFLISSGLADFAMIKENMAEVIRLRREDDFSTSLKRGMVQYRMYRHSNVPSLVQNNSKYPLKPNTRSLFSMKKYTSHRYHPYLKKLTKHREDKNKPQTSSSDIQLESKMIGYQPNYDPKHFIESF